MSGPRLLLHVVAPALVAGVAALAALAPGWGADPVVERVSVTSGGDEGAADSLSPALSDDGRYVALVSDATLVPGDTNLRDAFVHDRMTGVTELVGVASDGTQADRAVLYLDISGDGRYVVFSTDAANLVAGDTNDADDIFLHDRETGATERVSLTHDGLEGNTDSITPSVSGDGRYVTFSSRADNLVVGDANDDWDVFLRDRVAGTTELISVATDGTQADLSSGWLGAGRGRVSDDGRYVAFGSFATNLVDDDTNGLDDVFLRDRVAGTTERASVSSGGVEGTAHSMYPDVSDDGRFVVFHSAAEELAAVDTNGLTDVFLRDRVAGTTTLVSHAPGGDPAFGPSQFAVVSGDGTVVAFESAAADLVPGDTNVWRDVFAYDIASSAMTRVSIGPGGVQGDESSLGAAIDEDGDVVAFHSDATNLVDSDANGHRDVFVYGKSIAVPTPTGTSTPTPTPTPTITPTPSLEIGDANCSGSVTSIDAAVVLQFVAALLPALPCPTEADANADGTINAIDSTVVLQFVAGLLVGLPP